jgi:hypothetical protein
MCNGIMFAHLYQRVFLERLVLTIKIAEGQVVRFLATQVKFLVESGSPSFFAAVSGIFCIVIATSPSPGCSIRLALTLAISLYYYRNFVLAMYISRSPA